jgi:uncharacterized protein YacL
MLRNTKVLTNDLIVVKFCEAMGIKVLNLKDVLIFIPENGLVPKDEMVDILRDTEDKDNTVIKGQEDILEGH